MTDPFPDRRPGGGWLDDRHAGREAGRNRKHNPESLNEESSGCLGVLLILLGIPPILLGLFFGLCAFQFPVGELFLIAFVCFGVGAVLVFIGARLTRNNGGDSP